MLHSSAFRRTVKLAVVALSIFAVASLAAAGQTPAGDDPHPSLFKRLQARDELNKGVKAFKAAHYEEAISRFQKATELDPGLPLAKAYLGVAVAQTVIPGLDTPENLKTARRALDLFQEVLEKDPHDVNSMKQIAGIDYDIKNLEDAKAWQKKVLAENPKDPEAAYTIGVIDWQEAHQNVLQALVPAGIQDDGEGNAAAPAEVLETIKAQNSALVDEALDYLHLAVENRPNYDDAMAYLNLVYRRKADVDWRNEAARKDDLVQAENWRNKAMYTRKANEEKMNAAPVSVPQ
jgi:tetratricopeptide (TPR) repeat protein